ncbi:MAG: hypothetical protein ACR2LR_28415 [Hassallia sp.]
MNHTLYARLLNGLGIVAANSPVICSRIGHGKVWRHHSIHSIGTAKGGHQKINQNLC